MAAFIHFHKSRDINLSHSIIFNPRFIHLHHYLQSSFTSLLFIIRSVRYSNHESRIFNYAFFIRHFLSPNHLYRC